MSLPTGPAPYQLLDDGYTPEPCDVLVIGCGNILRGDDAVGPILVRELAAAQAAGDVPAGVRLVDGGTAGMDVAFGMRGAARVVLVDATQSQDPGQRNAPGTLYRLPASAVADLPPLEGLHTHNFRWDHALAFAEWLLGPQKPTDITVFLVEAAEFGHGLPLTPAVEAAMRDLMVRLGSEFWPEAQDERVRGGDPGRAGARAMVGLPGGHQLGGRGPAPAAGLSDGGEGTPGGRRRETYGGASAPAEEASR